MKESVYIETTVISYLTAWLSRDLIRAAHQQITQEWWQNRRDDFELFISEFVINEAGSGDKEAAEQRLAALDGIVLLDVNSEVENLAKSLITEKALPTKAATDALHIAVASVHGINYLLSWNCKHIANAEMQEIIGKVCTKNGYKCPIICTPEELLGGKYDLEG
jgi:predicted nucleic acid-binding protein